jgi:hypothetical protein
MGTQCPLPHQIAVRIKWPAPWRGVHAHYTLVVRNQGDSVPSPRSYLMGRPNCLVFPSHLFCPSSLTERTWKGQAMLPDLLSLPTPAPGSREAPDSHVAAVPLPPPPSSGPLCPSGPDAGCKGDDHLCRWAGGTNRRDTVFRRMTGATHENFTSSEKSAWGSPRPSPSLPACRRGWYPPRTPLVKDRTQSAQQT